MLINEAGWNLLAYLYLLGVAWGLHAWVMRKLNMYLWAKVLTHMLYMFVMLHLLSRTAFFAIKLPW